MLPRDLLSANVDALVRAQGFAPHVATVRDDMRVSMHGDELRAELCIGDNEWRPVDFPAAFQHQAKQRRQTKGDSLAKHLTPPTAREIAARKGPTD